MGPVCPGTKVCVTVGVGDTVGLRVQVCVGVSDKVQVAVGGGNVGEKVTVAVGVGVKKSGV